MLAPNGQFFSSCLSLPQWDTHTKLTESQRMSKQQHLAENLDRKLLVVFDLSHALTAAFLQVQNTAPINQAAEENRCSRKVVGK